MQGAGSPTPPPHVAAMWYTHNPDAGACQEKKVPWGEHISTWVPASPACANWFLAAPSLVIGMWFLLRDYGIIVHFLFFLECFVLFIHMFDHVECTKTSKQLAPRPWHHTGLCWFCPKEPAY